MLNGPRKNQLGIACIGGLALFGCCFIGAKHLRQPAPIVFETPAATPATPNSAAQTMSKSPGETKIVVHVAGAVKNPGVYRFPFGSRVVDAVHVAGGPTSNANLDEINLAAKLVDGSQMRVPSKSATTKSSGARNVSSPINKLGSLPPVTIDPAYVPTSGDIYKSSDSPPPDKATQPAAASAHAWSKKSVGDANINTASLAELQSLPGVGASTAQKIIDFREQHGGFKTVDDLLGVPGIGPKKLEKMRAHVKL